MSDDSATPMTDHIAKHEDHETLPGHLESPHSSRNAATTPPASNSSSFLGRTLSKQNRDAAVKFFTAYGQTWVGLNPVWLMGEALSPGTKVGTQFKKGKTNLIGAAEEIRVAVATSSKDIIVIVDDKLRAGKIETGKTAEVLKAAGENAILVVSSSIDKAQEQLHQAHAEYGPKIRKSVLRNGRDVIVVLDKALKNPLVITGVAKFAKMKGIPHADALLRLGSLALAKILNEFPEEPLEGIETMVEEIDAAELERTSTREDAEEAADIGKQGHGESPKVMPTSQNPSEKTREGASCEIL